MTFAKGQHVSVLRLKRSGTIVDCLGGNRYLVALGSLTVSCSTSELTPVLGSPATSPTSTKASVTITPVVAKPPATIDLHGLTVAEASRRLETWLSQVIVAGLHQVKVIHGLGTGRLQEATHNILRSVSTVRSFRVNEWNPGETDVFL